MMIRLLPIFAAVALIFVIFVLDVELPDVVLIALGVGGALFYLNALAADDKFYVLATNLLYIPFSKIAPFDLFKGVNLTNILVLSLFLRYCVLGPAGRSAGDPRMRKSAYLILVFLVISFVHALFRSYSPGIETLATALIEFMIPWLFFLGISACLSSTTDVKHALLFSWCGYLLSLLYGFNEFREKRWNSSIEKSRIGGTLEQSNSYAAYIVYALPLLVACMLYYRMPLRIPLALTLLLGLRVMLATFSRGGYLALAGALVTQFFFRGKMFFIASIFGGCLALTLFPGLMPESVRVRLISHTFAAGEVGFQDMEEKVDHSSATRLVLWDAAGRMIAESPLLGKGLMSFPQIVDQYFTKEVRERDPHNMFLKIAVYMGLPALCAYLYFIVRTFNNARRLLRSSADPMRRSVALGAIGACLSLFISCMFGSRMENMELLCYFMTICAMVSFLSTHPEVEA